MTFRLPSRWSVITSATIKPVSPRCDAHERGWTAPETPHSRLSFHHFEVMSLNVLYKVACELDFPEKIVSRALRKYSFKDAGSFVNYLETHMEEFEQDTEEERQEGNIQEFNSPTSYFNVLQETELLYRQSLCLVCRKNKRSFVTLPCSHFTLCWACEPKTKTCPVRGCQSPIECSIQTYGAWFIQVASVFCSNTETSYLHCVCISCFWPTTS